MAGRLKSCMELIDDGMEIQPNDVCPPYQERNLDALQPIEEIKIPVLIIGGGQPVVSSNRIRQTGIQVLLVDDKHRWEASWYCKPHRFFGSMAAVYAGTRGIDIATRLENELRKYPCVDIWTKSTCPGSF